MTYCDTSVLAPYCDNPKCKKCNSMEDKTKVYCKYCKYCEDTRQDGGDVICLKEVEKDSAFSRYKEQIWNMREQNRNNDCEYYKYKKYEPKI